MRTILYSLLFIIYSLFFILYSAWKDAVIGPITQVLYWLTWSSKDEVTVCLRQNELKDSGITADYF